MWYDKMLVVGPPPLSPSPVWSGVTVVVAGGIGGDSDVYGYGYGYGGGGGGGGNRR